MLNVRAAAVSGLFYPANPLELQQTVRSLLAKAHTAPLEGVPKAIIAPHAGYVYSGPVAASIYSRFQNAKDQIKRVVLLGPNHRVPLVGIALSSAEYFATPLGNIQVDTEACRQLSELPYVSINDNAHLEEHSLEVHLPFLQTLFSNFSVIPLVVGQCSPEEVANVLKLLWGGEETLIVVSSDLSHFHSYEESNRLDSKTTQTIERLDYSALTHDQACGRYPVSGLLLVARQKHMTVSTLDLRNSGDTAGPRDRVVGYGAYAFN